MSRCLQAQEIISFSITSLTTEQLAAINSAISDMNIILKEITSRKQEVLQIVSDLTGQSTDEIDKGVTIIPITAATTTTATTGEIKMSTTTVTPTRERPFKLSTTNTSISTAPPSLLREMSMGLDSELSTLTIQELANYLEFLMAK